MADEEISKAFRDLQFKTNETRMRIVQGEQNKKVYHQQALQYAVLYNVVDRGLEKREFTKKMRISESTIKNIADLDENLKYYRSVGRMFLLTDKAAELSRHESEAKQSKGKIEAIEKQKEYLEKGLVEAESNLRELIQSRR